MAAAPVLRLRPSAPTGAGQRPRRTGMTDNGRVSDLPRKAVTRTAKLATLPLGFAGRTALGFGRRMGGRPAELVAAEVQARTAEQMFKVLGELKGGAMKFGQAMSIFEAALPEEIAAPYRATLTKLQDAAPALPAATVHRVLRDELGPQWRRKFAEFDDRPAAARCTERRGRAVVRSPSRCSTRAPGTRCSPTSRRCRGWPGCRRAGSPAST